MRIVLVPYDARWPEEFARESSSVAPAMGPGLVAIHHIGSTAIPGMRAKPVIDMLAVLRDVARLDGQGAKLATLGYEALGEFGIPGRRYFRKDDAAGNRTHQIHAFQAGSPQIARHLAFRDYLITHREAAERYDALKARLAALHPEDIARYTDGKDEFIQEIDAVAAAWWSVGA